MSLKMLKEMNEVTEEYSRSKQIQLIDKIAREVASQLIASAERVSSDKASRDIVQTNLDELLNGVLEEIELDDWEVNLSRDYIGESMVSDLKRKFQGKVSGKAQIKRIALSALQRMVDGIKDMDNAYDKDDSAAFRKYIVDQRKELVDAIKIIKAVED